ncbi:MAG TPA: hypothetical protein PKG77_02740 [Phycisphaerae bacterium]|nr:hypothetical protein [Phycisphaerae bacterium]HQL72540.1 hypothetical protein [Phycisphaerae bacterium]
MSRRVLLSVCCLLALSLPARAGKLHTGMKELLDDAEKSGRPVLIVYVMGKEMKGGSDQLRDYMLKDQGSRVIVNLFEVGEIDLNVAGGQVREHMSKVAGKDGRVAIPIWVIATPEGDFIDGGDANSIKMRGQGNWRERVVAVARKHPPINEQDRKKAQDMLDQARKDLDAGQAKKASVVLPRLASLWYPKKLIEERKKLALDIEHKSEDSLQAADQLVVDGQLPQAALAYDRIQRNYPPELAATGKAAKKLRDLLAQKKEVAVELARLRKEEDANDLLLDARRMAQEPATVARAKVMYRAIIQAHAQTAAAAQAKQDLEKLESGTTPVLVGTGPASPTTKPAAVKPATPKDSGEAPVILLPEK